VAAKTSNRPSQVVENLESRILCRAPRPVKIATAFLDNRGQAFLTVTQPLDTSTLSRKTAALYTDGADNVFGTADDARLYTKVGYRKGRLSLRADALGLNERYRVVLNSSVIKDVNGLALDGEFNGMPEISGDGTPGGNYDVVSTPAAKTRARFSTVAGYMNIGLYRNTPNTKANFQHYANEGAWDGTVFHRSVRTSAGGIDIIQGGGFNVGGDNKVHVIHQETGIGLELANSNVRGTIAMARTSDPNSNTNQWFFNVQDNTVLDTTGGGYTAFGAVLDQESLNTMDALAAMPTATVPAYTADAPYNGASFDDVPIIDAQRVIARSPQANQGTYVFDPGVDYPAVQRVAYLFDIAATPGTTSSVSRSVAATAAPATPALAPTFSALAIDEKNSVLCDAE
jgi:peptidyl-prolyl cis-trans isomerase A (cyclophilin A)